MKFVHAKWHKSKSLSHLLKRNFTQELDEGTDWSLDKIDRLRGKKNLIRKKKKKRGSEQGETLNFVPVKSRASNARPPARSDKTRYTVSIDRGNRKLFPFVHFHSPAIHFSLLPSGNPFIVVYHSTRACFAVYLSRLGWLTRGAPPLPCPLDKIKPLFLSYKSVPDFRITSFNKIKPSFSRSDDNCYVYDEFHRRRIAVISLSVTETSSIVVP